MGVARVRNITVGAVVALALMVASALPLAAQATGTIRGTVTDAVTMRPVAGAQISLVGTTRGALANPSGQYIILNVPVGAYTVQAEIIGFGVQTLDVTVAADQVAVADFTLSQQAISLDELVVTGTAGRTQQRAVGNSVTRVRTAQITEVAPIQNVKELLMARAPGLTLMSTGGEAGAGQRIRIRGASSITAGNDPVVYVDGVRIESGYFNNSGASGGTVQSTSTLSSINPNDIESIEVIKGPAASTLYGAEAAGGVIQIITKKGRAGGQGVQMTAQVEYGQTDWGVVDIPTNYWLCTDAQINNPGTYPGCQRFTTSTPMEDRLLSMNPVRDDPAATRVGDLWGVNVSMRGGSDAYNYFLSFENASEEGVFYNNFDRRTGGRGNFGFVPSENVSLQVNVGYTRTRTRMPLNNNASNGILRNGFRGRPDVFNDPWKPGWRGFSPELSNEYNNQIWGERLILGMTANYNPASWLENRLTVGLDRDDRQNRTFYPPDTTGRAPWGTTAARGTVNWYMPVVHRWTADYAGTATFKFAENYTSALSAGMQLQSRRRVYHTTYGAGLLSANINTVSTAATTTAANSWTEQTSLGFFVQEQVSWKDRLYATAAVRVDDNSAFGNEFSMVVYPKASLSYVISDEDWFNVNWIDQLKLRGAWGQAGNAPPPFAADRTFGASQTTWLDETVNYLTFGSYGNPNLKAETGQEIELGFDGSLLDGRVGVDLTYYYQQTKDALVSVRAPPSSGWSGTYRQNIGEVKNTGLEVVINASPVRTPRVEWNSLIGINFTKNELVSFGRYPDGSAILDEVLFSTFRPYARHREGYPLGGLWAIDVLRDERGVPVVTNGRVTVLDQCVWTPTDPEWTRDQCQEQYMGPAQPTREVAFSNTLTLFGNWRVFANLDYKGGHYQWCAMCSLRNRTDLNAKLVNTPNPDPDLAAEILAAKSMQTKMFIQKADFVKLREVSLSYTMPREWAGKLGAENATLSLSGRNLWYWTDYWLDDVKYDPEVSFYTQSEFDAVDYASMPMMRRWTLSMRVGF
jgi:TonB-dependent starch-binding outer membrane protein SusC